MFASPAAMVIANARRYRDEQRARSDLETVINTSPVGVVVFDAATGDVVSFNREVKRIAGVLRLPDLSLSTRRSSTSPATAPHHPNPTAVRVRRCA